ncbi:asparaginase [Streptococcus mitis]|nr:asparaginase [Streptococcus sp. NLN64]
MKRILALHTGGTISMQADEQGRVSTNEKNPMVQIQAGLENVQLLSVDLLNLPSPQMTPTHMLQLFKTIKAYAHQVDGVVITHGTDTLEETAYFLDTMDLPPIPVVITGAMRSSNELGSDGVYNFQAAIRVAADEQARDKGVLVVMNDEIHAAKYVTKTHTTNVSTFQTPTHGPLGLIMKKETLYFKQAQERVRFDLEDIQGLVPILPVYTGMDGELLAMIDRSQLDGLIIEAFGAGNIPPLVAEKLEELVQAGIPVALVSRCFNGIAEPVYAYPGGGQDLANKGIYFVKELNAPKARLKLLIALNAGLTGDSLKAYIEG